MAVFIAALSDQCWGSITLGFLAQVKQTLTIEDRERWTTAKSGNLLSVCWTANYNRWSEDKDPSFFHFCHTNAKDILKKLNKILTISSEFSLWYTLKNYFISILLIKRLFPSI